MKKHCGVDFFGGRISRGLVEKGRQRIEADFKNSEGKPETLKTAWNGSLGLGELAGGDLRAIGQ